MISSPSHRHLPRTQNVHKNGHKTDADSVTSAENKAYKFMADNSPLSAIESASLVFARLALQKPVVERLGFFIPTFRKC